MSWTLRCTSLVQVLQLTFREPLSPCWETPGHLLWAYKKLSVYLVPNCLVNFYCSWSHLEAELCQAPIASVPSRNGAMFAGRCSLLVLPTLYFPEPFLPKPHGSAFETVGWILLPLLCAILNCLALKHPACALKIVLYIQYNLNNNSSSACFVEHKKFILKFIQKYERLIIAKNIFQKNRFGELILPDYRIYY